MVHVSHKFWTVDEIALLPCRIAASVGVEAVLGPLNRRTQVGAHLRAISYFHFTGFHQSQLHEVVKQLKPDPKPSTMTRTSSITKSTRIDNVGVDERRSNDLKPDATCNARGSSGTAPSCGSRHGLPPSHDFDVLLLIPSNSIFLLSFIIDFVFVVCAIVQSL